MTARATLRMISEHYKVPMPALLGPSRAGKVGHARAVCYRAMKRGAGMTSTDIAEFFARDHSTVSKVITALEDRMDRDQRLYDEVMDVCAFAGEPWKTPVFKSVRAA